MSATARRTPDSSPVSDLQDEQLKQWLDSLSQTDQTLQNVMSFELWVMAQTMDELQPGFWSQYMQNRQLAVQAYLQEQRQMSRKGATAEQSLWQSR